MNLANLIYVVFFIIYFWLVSIMSYMGTNSERALSRRYHHIFYLLMICMGLLVALRPLEIVPDALAYYKRYMTGPDYNTIDTILHSSSWYRGCLNYSMSRPVNLLFYISYSIHIPYTLFVFLVVSTENIVFYHYLKKICIILDIKFNEYLLLMMTLLFYGYPYQLTVFAQGIGMCFAMPIMYFLIKKKYIKMLIFMVMALSIHISAAYFVAIVLIYVFVPKFRDCTYSVLWSIMTVLYMSGLGFDLGGVQERLYKKSCSLSQRIHSYMLLIPAM